MSKKIAIINEKGGVAKTTATFALGSILSNLGFKTIMLDLDPQSDLTLSCPIEPRPEINIFDCLFTQQKVSGLKVNDKLILIPGSPRLQPLEFIDHVRMNSELQYENPRMILKSFLEPVDNSCDFVMMDCPPNKEIVVQNALAAADYIIIPTLAHSFSLNGINSVLELVSRIRKINPAIKVLGILMSHYDQRNNIDRGVYDLCKEQYLDLMFDTPIRINTKLKENTHLGKEIYQYARELSAKKIPQAFNGFTDYSLVADEILSRLQMICHE